MDDLELEILLDDLESDRVERKSSLADKDKICEAICAFANDLPNHQRPGVLEIQNPGGPFGQVNRSNFGTLGITDYRNPHIAEAMKNLGYVQRFGLGIPLARKELARNGNPAPEFQVEDTYVLVTLRKRA